MKINMSEIIEKMAVEKNNIDINNLRQVLAIFIEIALTELSIGNEVAVPRIGLLYSQKSRKPRRDGVYNYQVKLRSSLTGQKIVNDR